MSSALVQVTLERYGEQARRALWRYLDPSGPKIERLMADYPGRGGKLLRRVILRAATRAFGGTRDRAIAPAVSLELLHNALLIHDDIEDASEERRGAPALHAAHGLALALSAGDALAMRSLQPVLDCQAELGPALTLEVMHEVEHMCWQSAAGQALELGWIFERRLEISRQQYRHMVLQKTCWLAFILPLRVGALLGRGHGRVLDALVRAGFFLGAAFQIQDDVLNVEAASARYGKEPMGDLWEGKRTLLTISLIERARADERRRIQSIFELEREAKRARDIAWIKQRLVHYGCIDHARAVACAMAGAAEYELGAAFAGLPESRDRRFLEALPSWVLTRGY